jgi:hypothetical protein
MTLPYAANSPPNLLPDSPLMQSVAFPGLLPSLSPLYSSPSATLYHCEPLPPEFDEILSKRVNITRELEL